MNKRKAQVCTLLLIIIMFALFVGSMFIEISNEESLYEYLRFLFFPFGCGYGSIYLAGRFYDWLTKTDE